MTPGPGRRPKDSLDDWLLIRPKISWPSWPTWPSWTSRISRPSWRAGPSASVSGVLTRDAFRSYFTSTRGERDSEGTARLLTALDLVFADAEQGGPLTFDRMAQWQRVVLGRDLVGFRTMPAFAKGGRERYGLAPNTQALFEHCLSESLQPALPLPSRAARTYLDVLFFHPFEDGNGRAAMLALAFVLARERVLLDQVHPLQTTRWADDPEGAADLARLLGLLISAAERRRAQGRLS